MVLVECDVTCETRSAHFPPRRAHEQKTILIRIMFCNTSQLKDKYFYNVKKIAYIWIHKSMNVKKDKILWNVIRIFMSVGTECAAKSSGGGSVVEHHQSSYWEQPFSQPYFDNTTKRETTTTVGQSAYLHCRVRNLGDRAVSFYSHYCQMVIHECFFFFKFVYSHCAKKSNTTAVLASYWKPSFIFIRARDRNSGNNFLYPCSFFTLPHHTLILASFCMH